MTAPRPRARVRARARNKPANSANPAAPWMTWANSASKIACKPRACGVSNPAALGNLAGFQTPQLFPNPAKITSLFLQVSTSLAGFAGFAGFIFARAHGSDAR
jgi:hypothetical protein